MMKCNDGEQYNVRLAEREIHGWKISHGSERRKVASEQLFRNPVRKAGKSSRYRIEMYR
jgi:hypothetical protein